MLDYSENKIRELQNNLETIRIAGGWTAEELGDMIGVTKQTIRNLELNDSKMNKTQYIALRTILEYEYSNDCKDNEVFKSAIDMVFDDNLKEDEKEKGMGFISGASKSKMDNSTFKTCLKVIVPTITVLGGIGWLAKIISKKK